MDVNDSDRDEIDLLVRELTAKTWAPAKAAAPVDQQVAPVEVEVRPGSRWTNIRILMPAMPTPRLESRFARGAAMVLSRLPVLPAVPALPALRALLDARRIVRTPEPATMVRLWVGLGAVYSGMLTFWPYPRTYFWGLVLYLVSLSLVLVTGIWGARLSWEARLGAAHTVALGTVLWGVRLAATQTLPPS